MNDISDLVIQSPHRTSSTTSIVFFRFQEGCSCVLWSSYTKWPVLSCLGDFAHIFFFAWGYSSFSGPPGLPGLFNAFPNNSIQTSSPNSLKLLLNIVGQFTLIFLYSPMGARRVYWITLWSFSMCLLSFLFIAFITVSSTY